MRRYPYATDLLAGLVMTLLFTGGGPAVAAPAGRPPETLTAEVKIVDEAGKRHTLHIDVQTNQVVKTK
jgi:hypothetical protein